MSSGEWPAEDTFRGLSPRVCQAERLGSCGGTGRAAGSFLPPSLLAAFRRRLLALPSYRVAPGDRALPHAPTATEEFRILVSN